MEGEIKAQDAKEEEDKGSIETTAESTNLDGEEDKGSIKLTPGSTYSDGDEIHKGSLTDNGNTEFEATRGELLVEYDNTSLVHVGSVVGVGEALGMMESGFLSE